MAPVGRTRARDRSRGKGGGSSPYLAAIDFTTLAAGAVSSLPGGLSFSRASSATVQTGTSTVVTSGIGVDVARAGRAADADAIGFVIEPTRTNSAPHRDQATGWTTAGATAPQAGTNVGPDGTNIAKRWVIGSGAFGYYTVALPSTGVTYTASAWSKSVAAGLQQIAAYVNADASPPANRVGKNSAANTSFARLVTAASPSHAGGAGGMVLSDGRDLSAVGGTTAGARDHIVDMPQIEAGKWAGEYIPTAGASATRAGERLYLATGSAVVSAGRLSLHFRAQLKHTPANADSAMRLWTDHADATTYVEIATSGVMTVSVGGNTNTTAALAWAANDIVDIFVAAGGGIATVVRYRVNGGATSSPAVAGSALGTIAPSGAINLLCDASAAKQPGCRVYALDFYKSGRAPAWAA
jgi:hypothetical protein